MHVQAHAAQMLATQSLRHERDVALTNDEGQASKQMDAGENTGQSKGIAGIHQSQDDSSAPKTGEEHFTLSEDYQRQASKSNEREAEEAADAGGTNGSTDELSNEEKDQVEKLEARDLEVKTHEMAHKNAAGQYARGGPNYVYQTGPDGKRYAVGGSVQIDTSEIPGDPQKTIQKMQIVRRAALAPAEPSSQDRKIAAMASQRAAKAQAELAKDGGKVAGGPEDGAERSDETSNAEPIKGEQEDDKATQDAQGPEAFVSQAESLQYTQASHPNRQIDLVA